MTTSFPIQLELTGLSGVASFLISIDADLKITWAGIPVLQRIEHAVGSHIADILQHQSQHDSLTESSINSTLGKCQLFHLISGKATVPLIGQWCKTDVGFILLANPHIAEKQDLHKFTIDDFTKTDLTIKLLSIKEAHAASLREAKAATKALKDLNKEMNCLYSIGRFSQNVNSRLKDILESAVHIIPSTWQYPDLTCARITVGNLSCQTDNFQETKWRQSADIIVNGRKSGSVDVYYLQEEPTLYEGPFLEDERYLIEEIADRLARITEQKRAEERYRTLFESSRDAIMTLAPPTWNFTSCNAATLEMFGVPDESHFVSLGPSDLSPEHQSDGRSSGEKAAAMIQTAMDDGSHFFEWTHKKYQGPDFPATVLLTRIKLNGQPLLQATVRDITKQRALEMQLLNAQKLESIGQLAAGIAHEINTPAQYVGDNTKFLKDSFGELLAVMEAYERLREAAEKKAITPDTISSLDKVKEDTDLEYLIEEIPGAIDQSLEGIERISDIVRAMKAFSHPGSKEKVHADINRCLQTTITVSRNEWKFAAVLDTDLDPELPMILCLPGEINQVFLNLIVNAAQAIEEQQKRGASKQGRISVSTKSIDDCVEIRIADTGPGIPQNIRTRVMDPFFTTKDVGKGTGQGLAISRSTIVDKHGGEFFFETEDGVGTTFIIRLPLEDTTT